MNKNPAVADDDFAAEIAQAEKFVTLLKSFWHLQLSGQKTALHLKRAEHEF